MPKFIDLTGQRVGALRVVSRTKSSGAGAFWNVICDCGATKVVRADRLSQGRTKSCGCAISQSNRRRTRHGGAVRGKTSKLYMAWRGIKTRCLNPNSPHYHRYGGRGVTMHPAWAEDFEAFKSDVGDAPEPYMTLDRIDNERGYEPGNVRWATRKEQANNRATNIYVTHEGEAKTLAEWADHFGWKYGLLRGRWNAGKRGAELFADPKWERNKRVTFKGETRTLREWADLSGVPYMTLYWRSKNGKDIL